MKMGLVFKNYTLARCALLLLAATTTVSARKFRDDDPLPKEPPPMRVEKAHGRKISEYFDFYQNVSRRRGEYQRKGKLIPGRAVNTLGEVPDNSWYTNRHYRGPRTLEEVTRGPCGDNAPSPDGRWVVIAAKTEGITPGFMILDSRGRHYMLKFDPLSNPEMATAADVISSKFFYALGYNVTENYLVRLTRARLEVGKDTVLTDRFGKRRAMTERDISDILLKVPRDREGSYRAVASLYLQGTWLGPFRYFGTRKDDPNDVVLHEHRRDLRGLGVFCAWLDHDDSRAINTLDMLVNENDNQFVKHYLIDFDSTLGSGSTQPKSPRSGNEYLFAWKPAAIQFFSLGLYVPPWHRAYFPHLTSVGRFEAEVFDPEKWVPEYRNPAFSNRLPDDAFWAAKQVMAFTDEEVCAIVKKGEYSDPEAEKWVSDCLLTRRDKIGRAFFAKVLPLDNFSIQDGRLVFEDLAVKHKLVGPRNYTVQWSRFNNDTEQRSSLPGEATLSLPRQAVEAAPGSYFVADIYSGEKPKSVSVYIRKRAEAFEIAGIDRSW